MKKKLAILLPALIVILLFPCTVYASETVYTETELFDKSPDLYLPDNVKEILDEQNISTDKLELSLILNSIKDGFADKIIIYLQPLSTIFAVLLVYSLISALNPQNQTQSFVLLLKLSIILCFITNVTQIIEISNNTINSTSSLMGSLLPAISTIYLLGNAAYTSAAASSSIALLITVMQQIFAQVLFPLSTVLFSIMLFEHLSPSLSSVGITRSFKKSLFSLTVFIFSTVLAIATFSGTIASAKDSTVFRTLKFAASNFIPIIGSAAGDALQNVVSGVYQIRAHIGAASVYALLVTLIPAYVELILFKLTLRLSSFMAAVMCVPVVSPIIDGFSDITDVLTAIITICSIACFFILTLFSNISLSIV